MANEITIDETIDITDSVCPMTFVRTKAALEEMEIGQVLSVIMNDGEPAENVPRSMKDEGQLVLGLRQLENGTYQMLVKKLEE
ncbi:MAG: sulfurtransferase TusA family protein [Eubacterium sp.]|nr:sulfurtransferase TusA family protein [Eubacterium sp.]